MIETEPAFQGCDPEVEEKFGREKNFITNAWHAICYLADYFLMELKEKGLPQGVVDSLKVMAELGKSKKIGQKEIRTTLQAVNTIVEVMG